MAQDSGILARFSIAARIGLALALMLAFLLVMAWISLRQSDSTTQSVVALQDAFDNAALAAEIDESAYELGRLVQEFIDSGIDFQAQRVVELGKDLDVELDHLKQVIGGGTSRDLVQRMDERLESSMATFSSVRSERALQDELLDTDMAEALERMRAALTPLLGEVVPDPGGGRSQTIEVRVLQVESMAYRYFQDPSFALVRRVKTELEAIRRYATELDPVSDQLRGGQVRAAIDDYEKAFIRAVQAKRAYLYLVGVVMGGDASEFRYLTRRLREASIQRNSEISEQTTSEASGLWRNSMQVTFAALLIGSLVAMLLALGIVRPLGAITRTFSALASGEEIDSVPGSDRGDEIGQMAAAAQVFAERNRETVGLLETSRKLSDDLERTNEELNHFVRTVSHDLKSPLVTTMGFVGIIEEMTEAGDHDAAVAYLPRLKAPIERMGTLITDLLDLSRIGRGDIEKSALDPAEVLDQVLEDHQQAIQESGMRVEIDKDLPVLFGNLLAITQVFDNLVGNALKYGCGNDHPKLLIRASKQAPKGWSGIEFKDNGQGIAKTYHEKVFALFERLETSKEGTGVGLSIVQKVIKTHGGRIELESEVGEGAAFHVLLPGRA